MTVQNKSTVKPRSSKYKQGVSKRASTPKASSGKKSAPASEVLQEKVIVPEASIAETKNVSRDRSKSLEKLREALLERRNSMRRSWDSDSMDDSQADVLVGDAVDAATELSESELEYHFFEVESREFGQIEHAIKRFEEGTYGTCEGCGQPIPIARLKVLPFACKCVKCQQLDDEEKDRSSFRGWRYYDYSLAKPTNDFTITEKEIEYGE